MACSYSTNESYVVSQKYSIPRKKKTPSERVKITFVYVYVYEEEARENGHKSL